MLEDLPVDVIEILLDYPELRSIRSIYITSSRGRGFKSRSRQFLEFHLCSFISFFHWFQFICVMYITSKRCREAASLFPKERIERAKKIIRRNLSDLFRIYRRKNRKRYGDFSPPGLDLYFFQYFLRGHGSRKIRYYLKINE